MEELKIEEGGFDYVVTPLSMTFKDVGFSINTKKKKVLLRDFTGHIKPGEFLGIIGPTGSGKTTLLDILASRKTTGTVTGEINVNGKSVDKDFKKLCGYVTQEDIFLPTLTVIEALEFYADLKLSTDINKDEKKRLIQSVLQTIGLADKANSKVGGILPGGVNLRGLSGGEKKRLNIGCSLVTAPSFLVLDEPTSGLDATSALEVVETLKKLSSKGVTILCSIHQPRFEIISLFTKSLFVVKGRQLYFGNDIIGYFNSKGYICPAGSNSTDYIKAFFFALLINCLVHLWSMLLIVLISNITGTSDNTFSVGSGVTIVCQLFLGFFVPIFNLPKAFRWIHYINPLFYTFNAWVISEFEGVTFNCEPGEACLFPDGQAVIDYYDATFTKGQCVGILVAYCGAFYVLAFLGLKYFSREKR
eukprot:gene7240-8417_t